MESRVAPGREPGGWADQRPRARGEPPHCGRASRSWRHRV